MKKVFLIVIIVFSNAILFGQINKLMLEKFKLSTEKIYLKNVSNKHVRSASKQLDKINRYTDTNATVPYITQAVLKDETHYYYNNHFAANQFTNDWLFNSYVFAVGAIKSKSISDITKGISDSVFKFFQYDTQNRITSEVEALYKGGGFDTNFLITYTYSTNNLNPDTATLFDNPISGLSLLAMIKNFISNDVIDSNYSYINGGIGWVLTYKQFLKYNSINKLIERRDEAVPNGSNFDMKFSYFYSGNKLDSFKRYESLTGPLKLIYMNKYNHIPSGVNIEFFDADTNQTLVLKLYQKCSLNSNNKAIKLDNYNVNGNDTVFGSNVRFNFDTNNDLINGYSRFFDVANNRLALYAFDSTNFYYSTFTPSANANLKTIQSISVFPNPVSDVVIIQYEANASKKFELIITDIAGKPIHNQQGITLHGNTYLTIDAQHWASGIYRGAMVVDGVVQEYFKIQKQ
jgi:Secretion system C-terminal sorting domain